MYSDSLPFARSRKAVFKAPSHAGSVRAICVSSQAGEPGSCSPRSAAQRGRNHRAAAPRSGFKRARAVLKLRARVMRAVQRRLLWYPPLASGTRGLCRLSVSGLRFRPMSGANIRPRWHNGAPLHFAKPTTSSSDQAEVPIFLWFFVLSQLCDTFILFRRTTTTSSERYVHDLSVFSICHLARYNS